MPGNPRGRPLRLRHPIPAVFVGEIPAAIVVRRPGPRLGADPIPAGIGSFPSAVAIRPPVAGDVGRPPAAPVGADDYPFTVRSERLIKITLGANLYRWQR